MFFLSCVCYVFVRICLNVLCGGLTSWLSSVVSSCEFVTFPLVILGQVWHLIVSIPDLCALTYFALTLVSNIY